MTVTAEDLASFVGAPPTEPLLSTALAVSSALIDEYLRDRVGRVPASVLDHATLQLASELWSRRNAPGGTLAWGPDGAPVRLARDAMVSVYPLLRAYRPLGTVG